MLEIDPRYSEILSRAGLDTLEAIMRRFARGMRPRGRSPTVRADAIVLPDGESIPVHYKQYEYPRPSWRFIGRQSKARREFLNYRVFIDLGLRVPETVACGEARSRFGHLRLAFILTRTIPDAHTLPDFWARLDQHADPAVSAMQRAILLRRLADELRRLHDAGFHHNDLVWRNLLVTWTPPEDSVLWWIDCPRGGFTRFPPLRRRRQIKDLAYLDKQGAVLCTPRERLRFLRHYLGASNRDPRVARLARTIRIYLQGRRRSD